MCLAQGPQRSDAGEASRAGHSKIDSMVIYYTLYFTLLICNVIKIPSKIISLPARTLVSPYLFKRDKANPYLFSTV